MGLNGSDALGTTRQHSFPVEGLLKVNFVSKHVVGVMAAKHFEGVPQLTLSSHSHIIDQGCPVGS